jgi:PIN domain nuclease of toxin-antitoxin system
MKRVLVDTHAFLWWLANDSALGDFSKDLLREPRNEVYVSAASIWEISIKSRLGKLKAPSEIDSIVEDEGFIGLPISLYHGRSAGQLPLIHRDPFDRMLVAQAQSEGLVILTADPIFPEYGISTLQANR